MRFCVGRFARAHVPVVLREHKLILLDDSWPCKWESQVAVSPERRLGHIRGTSVWQHWLAGGISPVPEPRRFTTGQPEVLA